MRSTASRAAVAVLIATTIVAVPPLVLGDDQTRQPPSSKPDAPDRKQEPSPPPKAVPRPPAKATPPQEPTPPPPARTAPPAKAVPRRPGPPRPQAHRPPIAPRHRMYVHPYYPIWDFDFRYYFPYGVYPYWRYGDLYQPYPYPPYLYPGIEAIPDCVASVTEAHGSVRIDIPQKHAQVFVDGFYVGLVEDFNGTFETLNLVPGPHRLDLSAPGYEPVTFEVNIEVGRTITYRTAMRPAS